jgi:solute:Na+ symporter, SSS family
MLDLTIVGIYLFITLIIGILASRNITNMRDYTIANKSYPTIILVATITATYIGSGMFMGMIGEVYKYGGAYVLVLLAMPLNMSIYGLFIAPRIAALSYPITIGDIMQQNYGKPARVITGLVTIITNSGFVSAQVMGLSYIFQHFLDVPYFVGVFISYAIVVTYSAFGGIKAVTMTDVLQFIILMIAIPMIMNVGIDKIGGWDEMIKIIPDSKLVIIPENNIWYFVASFIVTAFPILQAGVMQRIFMAQSIKQAKDSMYITAIFLLIFGAIVVGIAFVAMAINPVLEGKMIVPYLIDNILPIGLKGFAIAGAMAVIMSSADSYLNVMGIYIVHDVIKPLSKRKFSDKQELFITKISTIISGIIAIIMALSAPSVIHILFKSYGYWVAIVTMPLYAVIMNIKSSLRAFIMGAISGVCALIVYDFIAPIEYAMFSAIFAGFANFSAFSIFTYIDNNKKAIKC